MRSLNQILSMYDFAEIRVQALGKDRVRAHFGLKHGSGFHVWYSAEGNTIPRAISNLNKELVRKLEKGGQEKNR